MEALIRRMLALAVEQDPSIQPKTGTLLLRACVDTLTDTPDADAAEVARCCLARYPHADVSWVAHLARAAVAVSASERPAPSAEPNRA